MTLGATKYIGQRIARREDVRFLTGRTRYVDDIRLPGTVHAAFVRTPYAHAEIQAIRTDQAAVYEGVVGILTGEEAVRLSHPIRGDSAWPGWKGTEFAVLAWPRVHFVGQAVAIVAAVDRYVAEDAAELIEVDYHPLPVVVDPERAAAPGAMEVGMAANMIPGPYRIQAYEFRARTVATNKCPLGPYRGVARSSAAFTIERAVDEIARELGLDPVDMRLKNYVPDDAYPYTSVSGFVYDSASLQAALKKLTEVIGYADFRREQVAARAQGRYLGLGVGTFIEQTAHGTSEFVRRRNPIVFGYDTVSVSLDPSGKVTVASGLHSHGQGHETTLAQVVAERLGVPLADVRVRFGDTDSAPYGLGTFASRSAVFGGGAAWKAADTVRHNLLTMAAQWMARSTAAPCKGSGVP
jgi:CO/xanthine dehydrogenase Mo-binding subunit